MLHIEQNYIDELNQKDVSDKYGNILSFLHDLLPEFPITIAPSGSFLTWAKTSNLPFIYWLKNMVAKGQAEILGGAFYEPFFSLIPFNDVLGQIELLTETIVDIFGKKPHGIFIPFSAWEESIIGALKKCKMDYCLLDSRLFETSGLFKYEPLIIENAGKTIVAFPLEYSLKEIDKKSPKDFYNNLLDLSVKGASSIIIPIGKETFNHLLEKKDGECWFNAFLKIIKDSKINVCKISKITNQKRVYQRGFINTSAVLNDKVMNYSIKKIVLSSPSLTYLYAKILFVHSLCNQVRGDRARKNTALEDLWKGEASCLFNLQNEDATAFPNLLQHAYRNLLLAEKQARMPGVFSTSLLSYDFDMDGVKEFLFQKENINMYVHNIGGKVFEMDVFSVYKNYTYMQGEHGLFIDHLLLEKDLKKIKEKDYTPIKKASVFANNFYQDVFQDKIKMDLGLETSGVLEELEAYVLLKKRYSLTEDGMQVQYILKNDSKQNVVANFMVELTLAFEMQEKKKTKVFICSEDVKKDVSIEEFMLCPSFSSVPWVQIVGMEGKIKFMIELNETSSAILIPIYRKNAETIKENIIGIKILFYWNVKLEPKYDTEKMVFFKVFDYKKR